MARDSCSVLGCVSRFGGRGQPCAPSTISGNIAVNRLRLKLPANGVITQRATYWLRPRDIPSPRAPTVMRTSIARFSTIAHPAGPFACHYCEDELVWDSQPSETNRVLISHLDNDKTNNDLTESGAIVSGLQPRAVADERRERSG